MNIIRISGVLFILFSFEIEWIIGCQVQFYDIPGRRYHISKAYVQYSLPLPDCRDRCAGDENCWALMFYNTTNMCALTNLTVVFGYTCDYCFSAKKGPCINPVTTTTPAPTTTTTTMPTTSVPGSILCSCTCEEDPPVNNITRLNERISSLKLNKSLLSSTRRKLISADDTRPSAKGIGSAGIFFIVSTMAVFVFFDCLNLSLFKT
uniref:Apple domain-containing protein n=1 Tax=Magallana gigas TaxID=29159 RepID=A0A8W8INC3_MAGGI|nr:uncharacterized protein LOC105318704 [Crassostrea gigas]